MEHLTVKAKELKHIVRATFPKYRKRDVNVVVGAKVMFYDLNWSGGTKSEYRACTVEGKPLPNKYDMGAPAPWNNPFEGQEIDLPVGAVIVEGGYFCGKERRLYVHVHPDNMPKLLTV